MADLTFHVCHERDSKSLYGRHASFLNVDKKCDMADARQPFSRHETLEYKQRVCNLVLKHNEWSRLASSKSLHEHRAMTEIKLFTIKQSGRRERIFRPACKQPLKLVSSKVLVSWSPCLF